MVDAADSKSAGHWSWGFKSPGSHPSAVMNTYGRFPLALAKGKGCWVKDTQGRRYLDAVAGIATCTLGHSDRAMQRALRKQLGRLQHVSNLSLIHI